MIHKTLCKYCGAEIVIATTLSRKRMELDVDPSKSGVFSLSATGIAEPVARPSTKALYTPHSSTCPGTIEPRHGPRKGRA